MKKTFFRKKAHLFRITFAAPLCNLWLGISDLQKSYVFTWMPGQDGLILVA